MVQPADARKCDDVPGVRWFELAPDRCVAAQRHMGSVLVVVGDVLPDQAEQMPFSKHDYVIQQFAAQCADPSLGESVLPGRARRDPQLADAEVVHAGVECGAEDGIAIADQARRYDLRADGLHNLLGRPRGVRVRRHVDVRDAAALEREDEEDIEMSNVTVGTVRKSIAIVPTR